MPRFGKSGIGMFGGLSEDEDMKADKMMGHGMNDSEDEHESAVEKLKLAIEEAKVMLEQMEAGHHTKEYDKKKGEMEMGDTGEVEPDDEDDYSEPGKMEEADDEEAGKRKKALTVLRIGMK